MKVSDLHEKDVLLSHDYPGHDDRIATYRKRAESLLPLFEEDQNDQQEDLHCRTDAGPAGRQS